MTTKTKTYIIFYDKRVRRIKRNIQDCKGNIYLHSNELKRANNSKHSKVLNKQEYSNQLEILDKKENKTEVEIELQDTLTKNINQLSLSINQDELSINSIKNKINTEHNNLDKHTKLLSQFELGEYDDLIKEDILEFNENIKIKNEKFKQKK